jgi:hypothetical protein
MFRNGLITFFFLLVLNITLADTIYVTSSTDKRLLSYRDTLSAYQTGKSVCDNLKSLFRQLTNTHDYDTYFTDGWSSTIKFNQPVDTLLGYSEFLPNDEFPSKLEGEQFNSNSEIGQKITYQFKRLDTLRIIPYAKVVGAEMPVVYIYRKPSITVIYKKLDKCWLPKQVFRIIDIQTHFIIDERGKTRIPYNIIWYYESSKLKKIEWVDPIDEKRIIQSKSFF